MPLSSLLLQKVKKVGYGSKYHYSLRQKNEIHCARAPKENDGSSHDNPHSKHYDEMRQQILESYGVKFFRIPDREIKPEFDIKPVITVDVR